MRSSLKRIVFLFCCLVYVPFYLYGQRMTDQERNEKRAIVRANAEDADKAATLLVYSYHTERKLDSAEMYARKHIEIGKLKKDRQIWLDGYNQLAVVYLSTPNPDSAKYYLDLTLSETEHVQKQQLLKFRAAAYMYLGALYQDKNLGQEEAFSYFRKAIETSKKASHTHVYVRSSLALIHVYMTRNRYDEVDKILTDAYEYLEENDPINKKALNQLNKEKALFLANVSTSKEERNEAMKLMLKVYEDADSMNNNRQKALVFIDIALHFKEDLPMKELLEIAELNFSAAKNKLDGSAKGGLYQAYGLVLMYSKQYNKAIPYLIEAKKHLVKQTNIANYLIVCENLILAYEKTNQLGKIIPEFRDYKNFQDTHIAIVYSDELLELEKMYETEKKESENAQLKVQNEIIETRFRFSYIIGLLLLGLLSTGLYFFQKLKKNKQLLESANKDKNKIFALLAHDLRTPIYGLRNLSGKAKYLAANNRLNELDVITKQTDAKLNALNDNLDNLLLWALTESNLIGIKPVQIPLQNEINKIREMYADTIGQKKIIIKNSIPESTQIYTDLTVLQTLIRNLMSNAIKFSYQGGIIEFSLIENNACLELKVIDSGIGLIKSSNEQESSENSTIRKKANGTGVGLKICKDLAIKSNLGLSLVSNPEGGTIGIIEFKKKS